MQDRVQLGPFQVARLGLGCMGMSASYGARDEGEAIRTVHAALDAGLNLLDTAEGYGPFVNEQLLGRALKGQRDRAVVATKFGFKINGGRIQGLVGTPAQARAVCEASLLRLGVECIDVYYLHRLDKSVPIEETVGGMAELVHAGKVRALGLSEVSPRTLARACRVHAIAALQSEYSLWERGVEREVFAACEAHGVTFVGYSPLGRGFLTGSVQDATNLAPNDNRRRMPRFQPENYLRNQAYCVAVAGVAARHRRTAAEVALAWVLAQNERLVALFGSSRGATLTANLGALTLRLSGDDLAELATVMPSGAAGERYFPGAMGWLDPT